MVNLRRVSLSDSAPTDQLYRLQQMNELEYHAVELGGRPQDVQCLLDCRIKQRQASFDSPLA
jgi:hypothetical protein